MNKYEKIIAHVFFEHYNDGDTAVAFQREEMRAAALTLGVALPRNLGDVVYSFRYRQPLPASIRQTAVQGREWVIRGTGQAEYQFRQVTISQITPNPSLLTVKVPKVVVEKHYRLVAASDISDEELKQYGDSAS